MNKEKIRDYIHEYEYNEQSCNGAYSSVGIEVINLKINKKMATADILVHRDYDNTTHRYNNMEYPIEFINQY